MPRRKQEYSEEMQGLVDQIDELKWEMAEYRVRELETLTEMAMIQGRADQGVEFTIEDGEAIAQWKVDYRDRILELQKKLRRRLNKEERI